MSAKLIRDGGELKLNVSCCTVQVTLSSFSDCLCSQMHAPTLAFDPIPGYLFSSTGIGSINGTWDLDTIAPCSLWQKDWEGITGNWYEETDTGCTNERGVPSCDTVDGVTTCAFGEAVDVPMRAVLSVACSGGSCTVTLGLVPSGGGPTYLLFYGFSFGIGAVEIQPPYGDCTPGTIALGWH